MTGDELRHADGLPNPRWGRTHKIADRTWEVGVRDALLFNGPTEG
jgi:hypothetical protein